ncbi:Cell division ATP-binding protein FtsE [Nymphon striatum]|nr:Cell division ATP-binding protein FtsE [Nymphon striatum]
MPVLLTRLGLIAERVTHAFWPFWTILFFAAAPLILGWQDFLPLEVVWGYAVVAVLALLWTFYRGVRRINWPSEAEAIARVDARLPGRPIAALNDVQAIGAGDAGSQAVWDAHLIRMQERTREARAVEPDLRVSSNDPYGFRYIAVLFMVVALLFGSIWRVGSVAEAGTGAEVLATGPVWEGWIEPPAYTGKPTLYLADITANRVQVPQGSFITLRLYGEVGDLSVNETVSGRTEDLGAATDQQQGFEVTQAGTLSIEGQGGASWQILLLEDEAPFVELTGPIEADAQGEMSQPFAAMDDYGVIVGFATIDLDLTDADRRFGLMVDPDPRDVVVIDLPMPFSGDRTDFEELLIDNFSEHPWANLPVTLTLQVEDGLGQIGTSDVENITLPGRRFFQPVARAVIEQRRDILWSKSNAPRVAQVLRAVSNRPDELFPDETTYLRLRTIIRRLEAMETTGLTDEAQLELSDALWELALQLEEGSLADARARLERAQERLEEAMRNGASDEEIAELMQELREAMNDYMQQLANEMEPSDNDGTDQPDQQQQGETITQDELQALMDRIQELMEEGRMAEAMELMEQLNELMENLQMTEGGEGGEGGPRTPGQQSMEDLAETLRDQQDLTDEAFRDLQEQFNQGQQEGQQQGQQPGQQQGQGQQPGQQGQDGQNGEGGQQPGQQQGQGQGQGDNTQGGLTDESGQGGEGGGGPQSLAERQNALREGLNQLRNGLPGLSGDAAESAEQSLERAEGAMDGAEDALREGDLAEAIDQQAEAMDALRDGLRNLGQALAENQMDELEEGQGTQTGNAEGRPEPERRDPLGREIGNTGQFGTEESMLQDEINRRAEELLQELRERSADQERPQIELDYLRRLLDRFNLWYGGTDLGGKDVGRQRNQRENHHQYKSAPEATFGFGQVVRLIRIVRCRIRAQRRIDFFNVGQQFSARSITLLCHRCTYGGCRHFRFTAQFGQPITGLRANGGLHQGPAARVLGGSDHGTDPNPAVSQSCYRPLPVRRFQLPLLHARYRPRLGPALAVAGLVVLGRVRVPVRGQVQVSGAESGSGVIELDNVAYNYGGAELFSALNLQLAPGSFHFLTGPSGAGKTTLLKLCYGELVATGGQVRLFGQDARNLDRDGVAETRRRIGVVHQDCQFLDHLSVAENIALPLTVADKTTHASDLTDLLGWVGLTRQMEQLPPQLSGGERQRAALARAVIMSPEVILADEPTGNVDWEMSQRLLALLVELNKMGKTVLIATHDLSLIRAAKAQVSARVLRLKDRRLQLAGADL